MKMNHENETENKLPQDGQPGETPAAEPAKEETAQAAAEAAEKPEEEKTENQVPSGPKKEKNHRAKALLSSTKFRRGSISTAFTVGFLVVVVLINIIVGILVERYPSINVDLTKNGTNTLTEQAEKIVDSAKIPVTIYIIATEEQTRNDEILTDYGIQYSQVGILAAKIAERNPKIKVEYIDLNKNPTFASTYKSDNITQGDVIVKSDKRYRVLAYTDLFNVQYGSDGYSTETYSQVDSALASGVNSVIADSLPVVAFDTAHSEQLDATTYKSLLTSNSFETKDFSLLTDKIPDKTQMIVLGAPKTDYTDSEIKKLDEFLGSKTLAGDRTLLITFHPTMAAMPKLATFLQEWGIQTAQSVVYESDQSKYFTNDATYILSNVQSGLNLGGSGSYNLFTTPQSVPLKLLFSTKGTKTTYSLAKSNASCYEVNSETKSLDGLTKAAYDTAVLSQDTVSAGDKSYKANVAVLGSTTMFSAEILSATTFSNAQFVVDLSKYATGTSNADTKVTTTSVQTNAADITLSTAMSTFLGLGVFTILIPLLILVVGGMVYHKRRHL